MEFTHKPVLLAECIEALHIRPEGIYVDGTLGRAGHSREIAQRLTTGRLVCIDRDQAAIDAAQERLAPWMDRVTLVHSNFDRVSEILAELDIPGVDGILLGYSRIPLRHLHILVTEHLADGDEIDTNTIRAQ